MSAQTIIKNCIEVFSIFRILAYIHTYQGASFVFMDFKEFSNKWDIATSRSAPYNPKCNRQVSEETALNLMTKNQACLKDKIQGINAWETVVT